VLPELGHRVEVAGFERVIKGPIRVEHGVELVGRRHDRGQYQPSETTR